MTRKGLVEIHPAYLAMLIRGEMKIEGLPRDAQCVRAHYDIERDRLILLMLSKDFALVQDGAQIPFYPLRCTAIVGGEGDHTPARTEPSQSEQRSSAGGAATFSDPVE